MSIPLSLLGYRLEIYLYYHKSGSSLRAVSYLETIRPRKTLLDIEWVHNFSSPRLRNTFFLRHVYFNDLQCRCAEKNAKF
jgi:hypothetical protein